ncbi:MAG: BMP family protein [Treponema sp.]|jgi:basic membrane protein A|nr:BMP family protein [Treponema sp.]
MKKKLAVCVVLCAVLVLACSPKKQADGGAAGTGPQSLKIVLILPGPVNDQSWNAINYAGLEKCNATLGTKMEYVENVQAPDYESTFRNYAERGYDLIMAAGTQFDEAANKVAANYPNSVFCVVNGMVAQGDNVAPIFPREYEASYVAALIAGEVSSRGQFATIGGFPNNAMEKLLDVYEKVSVQIAKDRGLSGARAVRAYANSWDDVSLGKQMAETMIGNGADTLFVYANQVGLGSIQAAREKGVTFIGFSGDQTTIAPDTVVASVLFDFETFYVWAVEAFINGSLEGNTVHEAGIKENIFVPVYTQAVSQEIRDRVAAGIAQAAAGEVDFASMFANP